MAENKVQKDIDIDLKLLEQFLCGNSIDVIEKNSLTSFSNACHIHPCTNECLRLYYNKNLSNKKVLSVTSSGDHILHAALAGAPSITGFDINRLCKYYASLKIAMIKKYNLEDFFHKIDIVMSMDEYTLYKCKLYNSTSTRKTFIKNMSNIIFEVQKYLNEDEIPFWEKVIDIVKQGRQLEGLFVRILRNGYLHNEFEYDNAWTDKENFSKLKYNLSNCEIRFIDSNVNTLHEKTNEKFDFIYLSNIIGIIPYKEELKKVELLSYLTKILNNSGEIYDWDWMHLPFKIENKAITTQYKVDYLALEDDAAHVHDHLYKYIKR